MLLLQHRRTCGGRGFPRRCTGRCPLLLPPQGPVAAVNSALNSFAKELLAQHMSTCVADDLRAGSNEKLDELIKLLPRLMK